jgi:hypothetical protein
MTRKQPEIGLFRRSYARHIVQSLNDTARNPSVSPLPSCASRPGFVPRPVTISQALREIFAWWTRRPVPLGRRFFEEKLVARLADEIAEEKGRRE